MRAENNYTTQLLIWGGKITTSLYCKNDGITTHALCKKILSKIHMYTEETFTWSIDEPVANFDRHFFVLLPTESSKMCTPFIRTSGQCIEIAL